MKNLRVLLLLLITLVYATSQMDELKANKVTRVGNVIPACSIITLTGIIK